MESVKSLKHARKEVRFERVFVKITKIFAKITREAPGFFGGLSFLDHEGVVSMKIFCKSGNGSQPHGKVPGRKKPERAQVHKKSKMFFKKRVLQLQKWQKMRVLRVSHVCCVCVVCVACVACVVVSVLCSCFCQSSVFWVEFAVDRFVAIRGKLRVSEVCSNKLKFSPL